MENFNLTDEEQAKFGEYFSSLDTDKQAKLSFKSVRHFLAGYQLGEDDLEKIFNLCGAKRLGHFCRSQFFIALKLVALAQNSYEINLENLGKANLPLARRLSSSLPFFNDDDLKSRHKCDLDSFSTPSTVQSPAGIILPPPPSSASKSKSNRLKNKRSPSQICRFCNRTLINADLEHPPQDLRSFVLVCSNCKRSNQSGLDSPTADAGLKSNPPKNLSDLNSSDQSDNSRCSSTELYETIDNSMAFEKLKTWEKIESNQARDGVDSADESKHCLLNEDEETVDSNKICLSIGDEPYDSRYGGQEAKYESANYDSSSFAIARVEEENDEDVWSMNDEQIRFYFEKFCRLLPSRSDRMLAGSSVKQFFEKSKLNLSDLSRIWSLADLDRDGHLTLIEFCIAMHLVVLKRNQVPLPDELPKSLSPASINLQLATNRLTLTGQSPLDSGSKETFRSRRESLHDAKESYGSITDSSSGSLPSYHHVSINVSNDNISTAHAARNSFDSDYCIKSAVVDSHVGHHADHHASHSSSSNPVQHLRNPMDRNPQDTAAVSVLLSAGAWTKFNNSPTGRQQQENGAAGNQPDHHPNHHSSHHQIHQINNQTNQLANSSNDAKCLMTPANFDKIELDPLIPHPMPVKVSSSGNQASTLVNKDRVASSLNPPPAYPARPRAGGHGRSSSLDLTRKMISFNSANIAQHQGAFVNYRKHLQQQQSRNPSHLFDSSRPDGHQTIADKQYYLNYLKNKYALPKPTGTDLVSELKERNFLIERVYELLIDDFASTLEQLSKLSEKS